MHTLAVSNEDRGGQFLLYAQLAHRKSSLINTRSLRSSPKHVGLDRNVIRGGDAGHFIEKTGIPSTSNSSEVGHAEKT